MFKLFGHFSLFFLILHLPLSASSFERFKSTQSGEYITYKNESDATFSTYLKEQWKQYLSEPSEVLYEKQKLETIAPTVENKIKPLGPKAHIEIKQDSLKSIKPQEINEYAIQVKYFGTVLGFSNLESIKNAMFYPLNQEGLTSFFNILAGSNYEQLVQEIQDTKKRLNLNDWGLYLLIKKLSKQYYRGLDEAKIFTWFLFQRLGYDVKVGIADKHIVVMYYSKKNIYNTPNYLFKDKKFYVLDEYAKGSKQRVYTYNISYPNALKSFDLKMQELPILSKDIKEKKCSFVEEGKNYSITFKFNKNLIDFMQTYPQADYASYFNASIENETYNDIAKSLKQFIEGKKMSVALNFVLHFVQKSFKYQIDEKQFGREKVMFAEETLYYEKSDCEDRAILFSYLVKKLFHIKVIGVKYINHMTTALYIPIIGDSVQKGSRKYIIADPTYINANVGVSMKKYKSIRPERFIVIN